MEKNYEKTESKFTFSKAYKNESQSQCRVLIDLHIDYKDCTFNITPFNEPSGKFMFRKADTNSALKWLAISVLIHEATTFAIAELNNN